LIAREGGLGLRERLRQLRSRGDGGGGRRATAGPAGRGTAARSARALRT